MKFDIIFIKDVLYLVGSILGVIAFIRTLNKRDKSEFNYRTEFGDEVHPFLTCIRGDIYNLEISSKMESFNVLKLPSKIILSRYKYKDIDTKEVDCSAFFPILKEADTICISNEDLKMPMLYLKYEDKYHNKYFQTFNFESTEIGNEERLKRQSRSCYKISRRHFKLMWIWF